MLTWSLAGFIARRRMTPAERERADLVASARRLAYMMWSMGGPDLRDLSDDELVERVLAGCGRMQAASRACALTTVEAKRAMESLAAAARQVWDIGQDEGQE